MTSLDSSKGHKLFIDSCDILGLGILDSDNNWLEYASLDIRQSASIVHGYIYQFLSNNNLKIDSIDKVVITAGPGSYTGMRMGQGILDIFALHGIETFSFYHFQVPEILGMTDYHFVANAFKKEVFLYQHADKKGEKKLITVEEFDKLDPHSTIIYSFNKTFGDRETKSTIELIGQNPQKLFSAIFENKMKQKPFYYRELEDEFKPVGQ